MNDTFETGKNIPKICLLYRLQIFFRRIVVSEVRYDCSSEAFTDITHVLDCRACRFDRCILHKMNPLAIKSTKNLNFKKIIAELNKED
uniref:Nuclear receptor domain-containing protein n=1 Tax=Ditylenchus dipsaci TaxID=166011 RepID=A0A915CXQ1_9BILA